jgi:TrmH family RNA methyltransferase
MAIPLPKKFLMNLKKVRELNDSDTGKSNFRSGFKKSAGDKPSFPARKPTGARPSFGDKKPFGDRKPYGDKPSFGDKKPFGDRKPYGDKPSFGDKKSFGDRKPYGDKPSFGDKKPFGDRKPYGDKPSFGDKKPFGDRKPYGDKPSFGDKKPFGDRKPYGDKPSFGDKKPFGDRKPYGDKPSFGDRKPFGDRAATTKKELPEWLVKMKSLHKEKGREKEGMFLAEGIRVVCELLEFCPSAVDKVALLKDIPPNPELLALIEKTGVYSTTMYEDQLKEVSSTETCQGVLAVCHTSALKPRWESAHRVTLLDGVQDPGNLGTIFRNALAFGMDAVILGKGTVDPFNPKVVRGSSGTFMRIPFEVKTDIAERINFLRMKGFSVLATSSHGTHTVQSLPKLKKKVAILMGNEGAGADTRYLDLADEVVRIPMTQDVESLNVAVAHGIISYQLFERQNQKG